MPVLRINATEGQLQLQSGDSAIAPVLESQATAQGPVIVMVHGYKYAPGHPTHCPHAKIFRDTPGGWPCALSAGGASPATALLIAFGWFARGSLRQAHARAAVLGPRLAELIGLIRRHLPGRSIHIIAHSLGSELALSALAHLPRGAVQRMVLLTGASFAAKACAMLNTPAGRTTELFNITSRENDLFDLAFERLAEAPHPGAHALGQGIDMPNALNLQLDCTGTVRALNRLGFVVATSQRRVCHWSSYTRPGIMRFYAALLSAPQLLPQARLAQLVPAHPTPRWSRLPGQAAMVWVLPFWTGAQRLGRRLLGRVMDPRPKHTRRALS
ncbi:alpha/beta hydrolase [uncultured Roseobacter sp.]|uniref:alpha/beta hydrolase n=1 Tax=uncultured Roseobacter sp. TaxID=114847 RepID=UPI002632340C|nr:alpha/beta hydrolase [uncultured Roseobacter sp.]